MQKVQFPLKELADVTNDALRCMWQDLIVASNSASMQQPDMDCLHPKKHGQLYLVKLNILCW